MRRLLFATDLSVWQLFSLWLFSHPALFLGSGFSIALHISTANRILLFYNMGIKMMNWRKGSLVPDGRDHTECDDMCERCIQHSGKICVVPVSPVSCRCVSVPQELPICHRMSQKMAGSGVKSFVLRRTYFIATAVSGFSCWAFFFSPTNLLGVFPVLIPECGWKELWGEQGEQAWGFFPL